jgi:hypothetical protein
MTDYTIIAEDPGDIVINFVSSADGTIQQIPLKSISMQKTTDVTPEYGTGFHGKYGLTQGKIDYKGDFEIGTWWVSDAENPEKWMDLIKNHLTWSGVQGLSREFDVVVTDSNAQYERTNLSGPTTLSGNNTICTFHRCLLTGDSLSVGNVGSTASTKYSFTCMSRDPA